MPIQSIGGTLYDKREKGRSCSAATKNLTYYKINSCGIIQYFIPSIFPKLNIKQLIYHGFLLLELLNTAICVLLRFF